MGGLIAVVGSEAQFAKERVKLLRFVVREPAGSQVTGVQVLAGLSLVQV